MAVLAVSTGYLTNPAGMITSVLPSGTEPQLQLEAVNQLVLVVPVQVFLNRKVYSVPVTASTTQRYLYPVNEVDKLIICKLLVAVPA